MKFGDVGEVFFVEEVEINDLLDFCIFLIVFLEIF